MRHLRRSRSRPLQLFGGNARCARVGTEAWAHIVGRYSNMRELVGDHLLVATRQTRKDCQRVKRRCFAHSFYKKHWSFGRTVQEVKLSLSNSSGFTSVFAASSAPHSPAEGLLTTAHVRSLRMCVALRTGAHFPEPHLEATMSEEFMMMWSQRSFSP